MQNVKNWLDIQSILKIKLMQNCTIVIPTYNRSKILKIIKYIVQNEFDFPILVVDAQQKIKKLKITKN